MEFTRGARVVVLVVAALLFFGRLGDRGITSEELRWAQIAREMRATGAWFHPTINGKTYYDKPLGSYWLIVAASYVTGQVDEFTARLPSAIAGWLGVLIVMSLGRRFYDARTGVLAGVIAATSLGYIFYARRASADLETVVGVLAAIGLVVRYRRPGPWLLGLWVLMATTSLTKGLLGFVLPLLVITVDCALTPSNGSRWRHAVSSQWWLWNRWSLLAIPLAATIFLGPFAISILQTGSHAGLALLVRENLQRFVRPHNHLGPIYLYLVAVPLLMLPWSLFLPASLVSGKGEDDRIIRVAFWGMFAFFTLSVSRRNYYILPIVPFAALLIARVITAAEASLTPLARRLRTIGIHGSVAAIVAAGIAMLDPGRVLPEPWNALPPLPHRDVFAFGWCAALVIAVVGLRTKRSELALSAAIAGGMAYAFLVVQPALEPLRGRDDFVLAVRQRIEEDRIALFHARDIVFDLEADAPVPEFRDPHALRVAICQQEFRWVLARRRALPDLPFNAPIVLEEPTYAWQPAHQAGDRLVLMDAAQIQGWRGEANKNGVERLMTSTPRIGRLTLETLALHLSSVMNNVAGGNCLPPLIVPTQMSYTPD